MEKASQFLRHRPADRQVPFWKGTAEYLCEAYLPEVRKEGAQLLPVQTQRSSLETAQQGSLTRVIPILTSLSLLDMRD